jgi:hypothetical protein
MARSSAAGKAQALDAALRSLYQALEAQPVPSVFRLLIEQLDAPPPEPVRAGARR